MEKQNKIDSFRGEYAYLSNFFETPVTYRGITYQNNEAAFQAQKVAGTVKQAEFARLNPSEAKRLGRKITLRSDWEQIKVQIMAEIVHAKFHQHPELAQRLASTTPLYLEEGNDWGDRTWGTVNGCGKNLLGTILMREREILTKQIGFPAQSDKDK